MLIPRSVIAVGIIAALSLGAACGEEPAPTDAEPTEAPGVDEVLAAVGANVAAMSSAKFGLVDETETGAPFLEMTFKSMEAVVEAPNNFEMLVEVVSPSFGFVKVEIVKVGDQAWRSLSIGVPWSPMPLDELPFDFEGLGVVFADLPANIQNAALTGQEELRGISTVRVEGVVESDVLSPLLTTADPGHDVSLLMWVDATTHELRQVRLAGQIYDDDGPETTRLLTIDDINLPVDIELPDTAAGG